MLRPHRSADVASNPYHTTPTPTAVGHPRARNKDSIVAASAAAAATGGIDATASAKNATSYTAAAAARHDRTSTRAGGGGSRGGRRSGRPAAGGGVEDADGEVHRSELLVVDGGDLNHPPGPAAAVFPGDLEERSVGHSAHAEDRADHAGETEKTGGGWERG